MSKQKPSMRLKKEAEKQYKERRIARFKTSGCALCWTYCGCKVPAKP